MTLAHCLIIAVDWYCLTIMTRGHGILANAQPQH
jgi:hypothetical protein